MRKDFAAWNRVKRALDSREALIGFYEREIWWVSFGLNLGVETDGKYRYFERPALILRKFNNQMAWVVPPTSKIKSVQFYEVFIFRGRRYSAAITQIRTISNKRLLRKIGRLPSYELDRILTRIALILKNENPHSGGFSRRPKP